MHRWLLSKKKQQEDWIKTNVIFKKTFFIPLIRWRTKNDDAQVSFNFSLKNKTKIRQELKDLKKRATALLENKEKCLNYSTAPCVFFFRNLFAFYYDSLSACVSLLFKYQTRIKAFILSVDDLFQYRSTQQDELSSMFTVNINHWSLTLIANAVKAGVYGMGGGNKGLFNESKKTLHDPERKKKDLVNFA